jgi:hypothetical protein
MLLLRDTVLEMPLPCLLASQGSSLCLFNVNNLKDRGQESRAVLDPNSANFQDPSSRV